MPWRFGFEHVAAGVAVAAVLGVAAWSPAANAQLLSQLGPGQPPSALYCAPGERPIFMSGFAALKAQLGDRMGVP